jgi:predicted RNase H-like HicB family nuclease
MIEIVFLVEDDVDGGYTAKALDHPIFTQGDTIDELKEMIRDAVICHFDRNTCPERIRLQFVREEVLAL